MYVFIAVTNDIYEEIRFEADSVKELSKMLGVSDDAIYKTMYRQSTICNGKYRIYKVELEEDNDGTREDS